MKRFRLIWPRHWRGLIAAMLVVGHHVHVGATSFDCYRATTLVEQSVCSNAELSRLDDDLAWLYAHIAPAAKATNKLAQRQWLRERNLCADEACLQAAYIARISSLLMSKDLLIAPSPGDTPGETRLTLKNGWVPGKDVWGDRIDQGNDPLCRVAAEHMNRYAADWNRHRVVLLDNLCVTASLSIPGMVPPPWKELAPADHLLLIARLLRFSSEGARQYFAPDPPHGSHSDAFYRDAAAKFAADGGHLLTWTTTLFSAATDARTNETINTAKQQQTIVQLRESAQPWRDTVASATCQPSSWRDRVFLVEADLSGPAPAYIPSLDSATVMLYEGAPVFLRNYRSQLLIDDTASFFGGTRCNLSAIRE